MPLMRSQLRVFILWGIAELPTWPGLKPSVTSSLPARRMLVARLLGAAAVWASAVTASKSRLRGYTCPVLMSTWLKPNPVAMRCSNSASLSTSPPSRSSISCEVPTGPLMPRAG